MSYEIVYGQGALDLLTELDLPVDLDCVEASMSRLAGDPLQHSRRGDTVYQKPDGRLLRPQVFDFDCGADPGRRVHFRAHFYFGGR